MSNWSFVVLSYQRSSNLASVFLHQECNLAALLHSGVQWFKVFQPISLHTTFRNFPVKDLPAFSPFLVWLQLFLYCLCSQFFFNHSACWLCSFLILQISLQNLILSSELGIILSPCFSPFRSLYTCFWLTWNSWFCLNCEILCLYLFTLAFFAINLCFNSPITIFIPFFFTLYLVCSSLILFLSFSSSFSSSFPFQSVDIPSQVGNITFNSTFPPWLFFLSYFAFLYSNFFCNPMGWCHSKFVWVTSSFSICLIFAFTFLVTSLSFLWSTFLKGRYSSVSFLIIKAFSSSMIKCFFL